jgi:hypothetical protein
MSLTRFEPTTVRGKWFEVSSHNYRKHAKRPRQKNKSIKSICKTWITSQLASLLKENISVHDLEFQRILIVNYQRKFRQDNLICWEYFLCLFLLSVTGVISLYQTLGLKMDI